MRIIECHLEFSGFDDHLVKAGTSVYLWNLVQHFRDAGHQAGAVTAAHGLLPVIAEQHEVTDLGWSARERIPVPLDPLEWPGFPPTVTLDVTARAHGVTVDGIDIVLLSGGVLDAFTDSFHPPRELEGRSLDFLKPLVFQVMAARYLREQVPRARWCTCTSRSTTTSCPHCSPGTASTSSPPCRPTWPSTPRSTGLRYAQCWSTWTRTRRSPTDWRTRRWTRGRSGP
ncbi:hypothetical protein [Streptomyces olivaceus]|uniref:hypothetical protein n=1 Tax=Streptomyces olivaceus TaxID=47716 RepID=UPI001D17127E|nr:hypothetical protein [Streptomyces olivaceus]